MKYALNIAEDRRILSATDEEHAPKGAVIVDVLPDGDVADYLYIGGEYIYEPLPKPEPAPTPTGEQVTWDDLDAAYQEGVDSV